MYGKAISRISKFSKWETYKLEIPLHIGEWGWKEDQFCTIKVVASVVVSQGGKGKDFIKNKPLFVDRDEVEFSFLKQ